MNHFLVVIEKSVHNYSAYLPDVPGCITTGKTVDEAIKNMGEALRGHMNLAKEYGDPIPVPKSFENHIHEIDVDAGDIFTFIEVEAELLAA